MRLEFRPVTNSTGFPGASASRSFLTSCCSSGLSARVRYIVRPPPGLPMPLTKSSVSSLSDNRFCTSRGVGFGVLSRSGNDAYLELVENIFNMVGDRIAGRSAEQKPNGALGGLFHDERAGITCVREA